MRAGTASTVRSSRTRRRWTSTATAPRTASLASTGRRCGKAGKGKTSQGRGLGRGGERVRGGNSCSGALRSTPGSGAGALCYAYKLHLFLLIRSTRWFLTTPPAPAPQGNYFFRLSRYQKEIEALLVGNEEFVQPASRRNEVSHSAKQQPHTCPSLDLPLHLRMCIRRGAVDCRVQHRACLEHP